ncbi:respiratory nitrate reductase subunit gamma [bacterium]|nr:respiratory nitrate reductase subunit gamma [bacterium]
MSTEAVAQSNKKTFSSRKFSWVQDLFIHIFGQQRILQKAYPGIMHFLIFWGMTLLFLGHLILLFQMGLFFPVTLSFPRGNTYLVFETISDFAGLALLVGLGMALFRRIILKPPYLESRWDDYYAIFMLAGIPLLGYVNEALRITATNPAWSNRSPIGNLVAGVMQNMGLTAIQAGNFHQTFVIIHVLFGLALIASIPFTKLRHLIFTPLHILLRRQRNSGELETIEDIDIAELLGAGSIEEFQSWQLLSFDACLRCGRCEDICPAHAVGMDYSPRILIQSLRDTMQNKMVTPTSSNGNNHSVQDLFSNDYCWSCTTCGACLTRCPAFINPVDQIIDLRRYHVLTTGTMPKTVGETLRNMERQGNPWGLPPQERSKWTDGVDLPIANPQEKVEALLFFGCAMSFDERNKKIARTITKLLNQLEINYAALELDEMCCGETARRMGHEYLFQMMAEENIALFREFQFEKIVTPCPHCYNTLKNEYPHFGGEFEVQHITEFLQEQINAFPADNKNGHKATFHDPCYLGRYNQVFNAPRDLINSSEANLIEMKNNKSSSFCCGGGGGQMWLETDAETRINHKRLEEAVETGADQIITACPYCLTMFEDAIGAKGLQQEIQVLDITEILLNERSAA